MTEISKVASTAIRNDTGAGAAVSDKADTTPSVGMHRGTPSTTIAFERVSSSPTGAVTAVSQAASADAAARVRAAVARVGDIVTKRLVQEGKDATFSAPGITALMMFAANGTTPGPQREAYLEALGFKGMSIAEVNAAGAGLARSLGKLGDDIKVLFANLAITNRALSGGFTDNFTADAHKGISASIVDKAFSPADAAAVSEVKEAINTFVADNTNGLIKDFVDNGAVSQINWYLLSCAAFKAKLHTPFVDPKELLEDPGFAKRLTTDEAFRTSMEESAAQTNKYRPDAKATAESNAANVWKSDASTYCEGDAWAFYEKSPDEVMTALKAASDAADGRMRVKAGGFSFFETDSFSAAKIPYGAQQGASIIVMQPKGGETPKSLLAQVGTTAFAEQTNVKARPPWAEDIIEMHPFETTFKPSSSAVLDTFAEIAPLDFGALTKSGPAAPNDAVLQAVINFGARETVAGQVAGMGALESAVPMPPPPVQFKVTGPFAYVIVSKAGDEIWRGTQG